MKRKWIILMVILLALLPFALASAAASFDLPWWSVDGGGGLSAAAASPCRALPGSRMRD